MQGQMADQFNLMMSSGWTYWYFTYYSVAYSINDQRGGTDKDQNHDKISNIYISHIHKSGGAHSQK